MKKGFKAFIIIAVCVLAFVGIYFLYNHLKDDFTPGLKPIDTQNTAAPEASAAATAAPDYSAPDFTVYDENGNEVHLSDFKGKPIVLNFWASWCYYCTLEMPDFNEAYKNNPDVVFLMVNSTDGQQETKATAKKYIDDNGFEFPIYYDTSFDASLKYGATSLPMTFFIDKNGDIYTYAAGMLTAENLNKGIGFIK